MATLHLIHGFIGTGKTTYCENVLSKDLPRAVRFNVDEWVVGVFGTNPQFERQVFEDYLSKISDVILIQVERILKSGLDVILDYGFWKQSDRAKYSDFANKIGADVNIHSLSVDFDTLCNRVLKRNKNLTQGTMYIDKPALEMLWKKFEPLTDKEKESAIIVPNREIQI